ncbi:MAG: AAA family ATPase [Magnetococcales bacterium]|nr:AAA family ATPase [Magnetococcales bacterium]MBF0150803.1 AAA family ATPase [Magnetococcales bacterium]
MSEENKQPGANIRKVSLRNLYLDPNNFRLIHEVEQVNVPDEKIKDKDIANRTYRLVAGDKNQNIQDLIESFKSNGYLPVDQIQVREIANGGYVVVEGNRRIAALKFLSNEYNGKSIDLGKLDETLFSKVPVVLYEDPDDSHYLILMALKHISGNRKWGEWNRAKLLEKLMTDYHLSEDNICKQVAISKTELRRSIRALALSNQYRESDYGDQFDESMFPLFREVARNTTLKEWIGWDDATNMANNTENRELFFSWLSKEPVEEDSDSDYSGKDGNYREPAISKRDDITILSKIIKDPGALEKLEEYRNLHEAYRTSDLIFKERIKDAVRSLASDVDIIAQLAISSEQAPQLEETFGKLRGIVEKARSSNLQGVEQTSVFHDRIDDHFSSITITAYRRLHQLKVTKISRINLFAGINNSGKTSILEAVYLLCKQNDFNGIVDVLRRRGKIPGDHIPPKWLTDQLTETIVVEGIFDNKMSSVEIRPFIEESTTLDRARYLKSVEISTQFGTHKLEALTRIYQSRDRETQADTIKLLSKVVFSSPFFFNEPHHYTAFYHRSVQSKLLPEIFQFIQEKMVPTVKDIRLVDEFQRFLVDDDRFESSMDLTSYGEGLQRIFFTSLLFASAKDGVVLIDEFENAIHADLIETFAPFIHLLAKEFNVQVFLTSHSKECIDSFVKTIPDHESSDFTFHALVEDNATISIREFDGKEFCKLIEAGDVDLRRAQ